MGRVLGAFFGLVLISASSFFNGVAFGDGPTEQVSNSLDRQDAWLLQSPNGPAWQSYLQTSDLREAMAAPTMDRRLLATVLGKYKSNAPGLTEGPFVSTKHALEGLANHSGVPMALRWAEQLRAATPFQQPFSQQDLLDAKYEVIDAKSELDRFLSNADYETQFGWRSFLKSDQLEEQLRSDAPTWKSIDEVQLKYRNGYPGLEYPAFADVRRALQKYSYIGKLSGAEDGKNKKSIDQYSIALAKSLEKYNEEPTTKNAGRVAALLDWLDRINRDSGLTEEIRGRHSKPNIMLHLAEHFLQRRFQQDINDSMYVNEMILKTHVRGTATTRGHVTADIISNPHVAQIDIVFNGTTDTVSVGRQKPVTIHSRSATNLNARKSLFLYPKQVTSQPTVASGTTNTKIHRITPDNRLGRKLVEKIAWKRAGEQKPQTEAIAAFRAARRLEKRIDDQSSDLLSRARDALRSQLRGPLNQRGLIPEFLSTHSDNNAVHVVATQAGSGQLSAISDPPVHAPSSSVVAQLHESAINNTAEKAIAGLTLTDERIVKLMEEMKLDVPEELQITEDDAPWSISFDWNQPVTVEFDNQAMKVSVRGRRFTSGERKLDKVMEMSATYHMETLPQGVVLTRQGDVEVAFPGYKEGANLNATDLIFKTLMQQKFSQLFKPVIEGEGFKLPGRFSELGVIRLNSLSTQDGWLSLGWK